MRPSCNGCRVLHKGCGDHCSIRPCLSWINSPDSQAHATLFLAKFYGRAGLINLINAGPHSLRPAIFRSLLYEACGRIVNPIYGSVGLLWSGSRQLYQDAMEAVLKGAPITPIPPEAVSSICGPPLKVHDIRHISKDKDGSDVTGVRNRCRFKRTGAPKSWAVKGSDRPMKNGGCDGELGWSLSHESSLSHQSEGVNPVDGDSKEATDGLHSVETSDAGVAIELTLGLGPDVPSLRGDHVEMMCTKPVDENCTMAMGNVPYSHRNMTRHRMYVLFRWDTSTSIHQIVSLVP